MEVTQFTASCTVVLAACAYALAESLRPARPSKTLREGLFADVAWYAVGLSMLLGWLIFAYIIPALDHLLGRPSTGTWLRQFPVWAQLLGFTVVHDLLIYGLHRLMHHSALWHIHALHHSAKEVDWASGSRAHALETLLIQTLEYGPIVWLGASPEVALWKGIVDAVWGMFIHANLRVSLGPLAWLINGPEAHRWHHHPDGHRCNFGTKLALWDHIFGTAHRSSIAESERDYGLDASFELPRNWLRQQRLPLQPTSKRSEMTARPSSSVSA